MLIGERADQVHLYVMVEYPHAVGAQPGEWIRSALRPAGSRRRPELSDEIRQRWFSYRPWQLTGAVRGQAAQRQQNQQRFVRGPLPGPLVLAQRSEPGQHVRAGRTSVRGHPPSVARIRARGTARAALLPRAPAMWALV